MTKPQAKRTLEFLQSSQLTGREYKEFAEIVKSLEKIAYEGDTKPGADGFSFKKS